MNDVISIKKLIVARIAADSVIQSLMGGVVGDVRIYPFFAPNTVLDNTKQGYITYSQLTYGEAGGRIRNPVFRLTVWALTWTRAEAIRDSIMRLFDKKKIITAASKPIWSKQIYEADAPPEATSSSNYAGKILDFRMGNEDTGV